MVAKFVLFVNISLYSIIFDMRVNAREQIKLLLGTRGMTMTALAEAITEKTGERYTLSNLSARMKRGTLSYNEVLTICEILDYEIEFKSLI